MALKMIKRCSECPDRTTCTKLCVAIKKLLPRDTPRKEIAVSEILRKGEKDDEKKDVPDIDKIRKIKRGADSGDLQDQEMVWNTGSYIADYEWIEKDRKVFRQSIDKAIPYGQTKLKRRFYSFLGCESMADIAKRANTSKQNIQQTFKRVIKPILEKLERVTDQVSDEFKRVIEWIIEKSKEGKKPLTPLKLKRMTPEWK